MTLRQFLYFDDSLVSDFLAQLEGGETNEVRLREELTREGKGDIGLNTGALRVGGGRGRSATEETESVIRQGRASKFQRLHELLTEAEELTEIEDDLDSDTWPSSSGGFS